MASFSLKFSKTSEKKVLTDSKLRDDSTKELDDGKDFIRDVKDNAIIGTKKKEVKKDLVIPLISKNNWRTEKSEKHSNKIRTDDNKVESLSVDENEDEKTRLERLAAQEILEETQKELKSWESRGEPGSRSAADIPEIMANSIPRGFEEDEGALNVSLRAEQSTLDDYENIPIDQYGLAMLRGMGWKPGEGIGGFKKEVVKIHDPLSRPKGLGLGATRPNAEEAKPVKDGEEELKVKRGAFILIQGGPKRGQYAEIEGFDEENGRLIVKLGVGGEIVSVSENVVKLVTLKEFKERGKVVNLDKFEKYKKEQTEKQKEKDNHLKNGGSKRSYDDDNNSKKKCRGDSPQTKKRKTKTWVRPQLRVRCIDSKLKGGRYYNVKMVVVDVTSPEFCDCRTDEGKLVEDVRTDRVESVVPKTEAELVMVVRGEGKGQLGNIVSRNKEKYLAIVQLLMAEEVVSTDYDSICQYVGDSPIE